MIKHNARNERIKHRYFKFLREAKRYSPQSVDGHAHAISRFEQYTKYQDFAKFHIEKAVSFKRHLAEQINPRTSKPLGKSTRLSILNALKAFFLWLADQQGYRSSISYSDVEYFNLSEKETRAAKAVQSRPVPTLEQIGHVLSLMPVYNDIQIRDRAIIAFTILTGSRDGATISLKLKHVDMSNRRVNFDGREVATKFSKSFQVWFFPVGDDIETIVIAWFNYLMREKLFGPEDPLFPKTQVEHQPGVGFAAKGLAREHWSTASPIREVFKAAFERAGLPYANPHSFRNTLAQLGERTCRTPEEFKAWSQNLGHEQVMTTFSSYGAVQPHRQAEIISDLREFQAGISDDQKLEYLVDQLAERLAAKR